MFLLPILLSIFFLHHAQGASPLPVKTIERALMLQLNSSINPATLNYISSGFKKAHQEDIDLLLIKLNTPGGLVSTTKDILTHFGESDIPVVVWIAPQGASATSAGAIIASGAHLLYMAQGTNIGAATPVGLGGGGDASQNDLKDKAVNDLVALVQALSETHGRNGMFFGKMVKEAASFSAQDAQKKNLINGLANTQKDLWAALSSQTLLLKGQRYQLSISKSTPRGHSVHVTFFEMDLGQKLLDIFANPNLTYLLLLLGAALLYLELQAPGGFLAGSIGVVLLILAGIGLQVLPLNFGALSLIGLSFILFVLEAYITSYGLLSLAGLASLIFGSLFLYRTDDVYLQLSTTTILSASLAIVLYLSMVVALIVRDRRKRGGKRRRFNSLVGRRGVIVEVYENQQYLVKVSGELWQATSTSTFRVGGECLVEGENLDQMKLSLSMPPISGHNQL